MTVPNASVKGLERVVLDLGEPIVAFVGQQVGHAIERAMTLPEHCERLDDFERGLGGEPRAERRRDRRWDLAGKAAGMPVHRLLGGAARTQVEAYASLLVYGLPHVVADKAAGAVADGFRHVKLHEVEAAPVLAAREAVGAGVQN